MDIYILEKLTHVYIFLYYTYGTWNILGTRNILDI